MHIYFTCKMVEAGTCHIPLFLASHRFHLASVRLSPKVNEVRFACLSGTEALAKHGECISELLTLRSQVRVVEIRSLGTRLPNFRRRLVRLAQAEARQNAQSRAGLRQLLASVIFSPEGFPNAFDKHLDALRRFAYSRASRAWRASELLHQVFTNGRLVISLLAKGILSSKCRTETVDSGITKLVPTRVTSVPEHFSLSAKQEIRAILSLSRSESVELHLEPCKFALNAKRTMRRNIGSGGRVRAIICMQQFRSGRARIDASLYNIGACALFVWGIHIFPPGRLAPAFTVLPGQDTAKWSDCRKRASIRFRFATNRPGRDYENRVLVTWDVESFDKIPGKEMHGLDVP